MNIKHIDTASSTNDLIKEKEHNQNLSLLWSEEQTKGRGQKGTNWESEYGKNLTFSIMTYPDFLPAEHQFILSKSISLAILDTLANHNIKATIKWPNDIYVNDKKICGILIECSISGLGKLNQVVLGVGLNVNQTLFVSDAPNPTSMSIETGNQFDREKVLEQLSHHFENYYIMLAEDLYSSIDSRYRDNLYHRDGYFKYRDCNRVFDARISGISKYGALLLTDSDGVEKEYQFKEVTFLLK